MEHALRSKRPILYMKCMCLCGLFLLSCTSLLSNQATTVEKVEGEGLTNFYVKAITQDQKGFLWFGTQEGLFRYDGYKFLPIKNFPGASSSMTTGMSLMVFAPVHRVTFSKKIILINCLMR